MIMDMILKTTNLCKNFKGQTAVNNVSLNIQRNSVYGLLGRGCKKSCVYVEIIFPDMNQICRNLLSNSVTSMLSKFLSDNSITSWFFFIHLF